MSAMTGSGVVGGDCIGELYADPSWTWVNVVHFLVYFRSFAFSRRLLGLLELLGFSIDRNPC